MGMLSTSRKYAADKAELARKARCAVEGCDSDAILEDIDGRCRFHFNLRCAVKAEEDVAKDGRSADPDDQVEHYERFDGME
jgi:hypothetical protein